jgi:hypothetical protein
MLLVFDQKASELRRENYVVRRILFLVGVHHSILLPAVNIDTLQVKPAFLLGRKGGYQHDLLVPRSIKCIAKQWIDHWHQKKVVRTRDFPVPKPVQTVQEGTDYHETLLDGLSVYYNPFAKYTLPRALFGGSEVAHYTFTPEDGTMHFDVPDKALFHHLSTTVVPHSIAEELGLLGLQEQ